MVESHESSVLARAVVFLVACTATIFPISRPSTAQVEFQQAGPKANGVLFSYSDYLHGGPRAVFEDFDEDGRLDLAVCGTTVIPPTSAAAAILFGDGTGRFGQERSFPLPGMRANALIAADFDGDGHRDLAVATETLPPSPPDYQDALWSVIVTFGRGDGSGRNQWTATGAGERAYQLFAGDFDEDGWTDLGLITGEDFSLTPRLITFFLSDGWGGFRERREFRVPGKPQGVAVADFDEDGHLDLIVSVCTPQDLFLFRGDGAGNLRLENPYRVGLASLGSSMVAGDFNEDGHADLVISVPDFPAYPVWLLTGFGNGQFFAREIAPTGGFLAADFTADGHLDVLVDDGLLVGDGSGRFESRPTDGQGFATADIDGDGFLDLLGAESMSGQLVYRIGFGDGTGRFRTRPGGIEILSGQGTRELSVGDIDGDGLIDFATYGYLPRSSPIVRFFLSIADGSFIEAGSFEASSMLLADLNGNGQDDLLMYAGGLQVLFDYDREQGEFSDSRSFPLGGAAAAGDLNDDGRLDLVSSLLTVLLQDETGNLVEVTNPGVVRGRTRLGHLNGDRWLDAVVVVPQQYSSTIHLYVGNGTGVFVEDAILEAPPLCDDAAIIDFDADGLMDIITHSREANQVLVFAGDGAGGFRLSEQYPVKGLRIHKATNLTTADLNEDGFEDVVVAAEALTIVLGGPDPGPVRIRRFDPPCIRVVDGDLDGDGHVDLLVSDTSQDVVLVPNVTDQLPEFRCRIGTVDTGRGEATDVLFVNGTAGTGLRRRLDVGTNEPLHIAMAAPPAVPNGKVAHYALYAWPLDPTEGLVVDLPLGIGSIGAPPPGSNPTIRPIIVWNNTPYALLGRADRASSAAPAIVADLPSGVRFRGAFFLQGIIADPASAGDRPGSVTNGVLVNVR